MVEVNEVNSVSLTKRTVLQCRVAVLFRKQHGIIISLKFKIC